MQYVCLQLDVISCKLREICPAVTRLATINRSNVGSYPELLEVMQCHARTSAYLVQLFKAPLEAPCGCMACRKGLWSPYIIDKRLARSLPHEWQVPLPIPLSSRVDDAMHYMQFEEARLQPLSDEHQPSLQQRKTKAARPRKQVHPRAEEIYGQDTNNKLINRQLARGVVRCADCMKPRVIYSATAPSRMVPPVVDDRVPTPAEVEACQNLAKQLLEDCCQSTTFVCGGHVLDPDHPLADVFQTQSTFTCSHPIEPSYYTCSAGLRSNFSNQLCAICADREGVVDDELKALFRTVLPMCTTCASNGFLFQVRYLIRNGAARAARAAIMAERQQGQASETAPNDQPRTSNIGRGRGTRRGRGSRTT